MQSSRAKLKRLGVCMPKLGSDDNVLFVCKVAVQSCRLVKQQSRAVELKRFGVCMLNWAILNSC